MSITVSVSRFPGAFDSTQLYTKMNESTFSDYVYEHLCAPDAARILVFEPAQKFLALQCCIIQRNRKKLLTDPENTMQYIVESYTWGEPIFPRDITCDGLRLRVTQTMEGNYYCG